MNDRFTKAEIFSFIVKHGLSVDAEYVYDFWKKKNWNTKKGEPVKTLAAAVHVCNSIYLTRLRKEMQESKHRQKKIEEDRMMYAEYNEQLESKEWEAYRNFILVAKGHECEVCGKKTWLQIHHKAYKNGHKAWEYLPNEVVVLCRDCHKNIHKITE